MNYTLLEANNLELRNMSETHLNPDSDQYYNNPYSVSHPLITIMMPEMGD